MSEAFDHPKRLGALADSPTVEATAKAAQLAADGHKVIDLSSGEPSFETPQAIIEAASRSMRAGDTHYTPTQGILDLRNAIADKLRAENGLEYDPDQILVTPSAKFALFAAMAAILEIGDEVLIPSPAWVSFAPMARLLGANPVTWRIPERDNFRITFDPCVIPLTARTKAIVITTPNNPTGSILNHNDVEQLVRLADEHNLSIISDEIYDRIVFDGGAHVSPASVGKAIDRTMTVNGFSKTFAMTGWRLGYLAGPREWVDVATRFQAHTTTCASAFVQTAGITALREADEEVEHMRCTYERRRDLVVGSLNLVDGIECNNPQGAFYVFPYVSDDRLQGADAAEWLLSETGIVGVSGAAFGPGLDNFVRLSFAVDDSVLNEALNAVNEALV